MSHLKGVIERLDFLQFVLSRSSLTISYAQLQLLWSALGEEAVTKETLDQLVYWIDRYISSSYYHLFIYVVFHIAIDVHQGVFCSYFSSFSRFRAIYPIFYCTFAFVTGFCNIFQYFSNS